jgi:hypothetical protein
MIRTPNGAKPHLATLAAKALKLATFEAEKKKL